MNNEIINNVKDNMNKTISNLKDRFLTVRAGRASASLVSDILVEYYGVPTSIVSLATVSTSDARTLHIKPFDKSCLADIEKAIFSSNIGITPTNNGELIILTIPPLTEDRRKEYVKQVKTMAEDAKVALRNIRQDANKHIKNEEISEDIKKQLEKDIQDLINDFNKVIDNVFKEKETELLTV